MKKSCVFHQKQEVYKHLLTDTLSIATTQMSKAYRQMRSNWPLSLETLLPHCGSATKHVTKCCVTQLPCLDSEEAALEIAKVNTHH